MDRPSPFTTFLACFRRSGLRGFCVHLLMAVLWLEPAARRAVAAPEWWADAGLPSASAQADDFAAANLGQLKTMTRLAARVLNNRSFPTGAGEAINGLIEGWLNVPPEGTERDDFSAVTVGQVKTVVSLFYERLNLPVPWTGVPTADDFAVANVGQLKTAFAFLMPPDPLRPARDLLDEFQTLLDSYLTGGGQNSQWSDYNDLLTLKTQIEDEISASSSDVPEERSQELGRAVSAEWERSLPPSMEPLLQLRSKSASFSENHRTEVIQKTVFWEGVWGLSNLDLDPPDVPEWLGWNRIRESEPEVIEIGTDDAGASVRDSDGFNSIDYASKGEVVTAYGNRSPQSWVGAGEVLSVGGGDSSLWSGGSGGLPWSPEMPPWPYYDENGPRYPEPPLEENKAEGQTFEQSGGDTSSSSWSAARAEVRLCRPAGQPATHAVSRRFLKITQRSSATPETSWSVVTLTIPENVQFSNSVEIIAEPAPGEAVAEWLVAIEINSLDRYLEVIVPDEFVTLLGGPGAFGLAVHPAGGGDVFRIDLQSARVYGWETGMEAYDGEFFPPSEATAEDIDPKWYDENVAPIAVSHTGTGYRFITCMDEVGPVQIEFLQNSVSKASIDYTLKENADMEELLFQLEFVFRYSFDRREGGVDAVILADVAPPPPDAAEGGFWPRMTFRNLVAKCASAVVDKVKKVVVDGVVAAVEGVKMAVVGAQGFVSGFMAAAKAEAQGLADFANMLAHPIDSGKALYEGFRGLCNMSMEQLKGIPKLLVQQFLSEAQKDIAWADPDGLDLIAYTTGYATGYFTAQVILTVVKGVFLAVVALPAIASIGSKVAQLLSRVKAGQRLLQTANAVGNVVQKIQRAKAMAVRATMQFVKNESGLDKVEAIVKRTLLVGCPASP